MLLCEENGLPRWHSGKESTCQCRNATYVGSISGSGRSDGVTNDNPLQYKADWGLGHELMAKFRLKLKVVGKTTRPFRYDRNQIPYDYTAEVTNTFKGLDLINRVLKELWQRFVILDGRW